MRSLQTPLSVCFQAQLIRVIGIVYMNCGCRFREELERILPGSLFIGVCLFLLPLCIDDSRFVLYNNSQQISAYASSPRTGAYSWFDPRCLHVTFRGLGEHATGPVLHA